MSKEIEVRAFMGLVRIFKERKWAMPLFLSIDAVLTGQQLITQMDIPEKEVEIIFVNGKAFLPADAMINPGDRVALVPPGTPGPYRVMLGFVKNAGGR